MSKKIPKKIFWISTFLIILFGFVLRIYEVHHNNFYFTVDQGRDAVYIREIINHHKIFLKGPETNIKGLFAGPLTDYFLAIGYFIFHGSPFGGVFMMILLNLFLTTFLIIKLASEIGRPKALIIGLSLQLFWPFFTTSLYAFHPFPLVAISISIILLIVKLFQTQKQKYYVIALVLTFFAFNVEVAGATSLLIFLVTVYLLRSKRKFLIFILLPAIAVSTKLLSLISHNVFGRTNFLQMTSEFLKIISKSTIPQNLIIGILVFLVITLLFIHKKNKNNFIMNFVYLTLILTFTSFLFFSSNHGWRDWHTLYLPTLIFISVILMIWEITEKSLLGKFLLVIILISQIINFKINYINYLKPSADSGLLYNQLRVLDFIYTHNENNGFNLYTYTNTFYDYNYQYLISWYGASKYGFYPCEYANFPLSIKALYIPGAINYVSPQLGCDKFRFLIIESNTNGNLNKDWINEFRNQTLLVEKTQIGNTSIEKRRLPDKTK